MLPLRIAEERRAEHAIEPLHDSYAILLFDRLHVRVHEGEALRTRAIHLALGIARDGSKEIAGFDRAANFVESICARGVRNVALAVTSGDKELDDNVRRCYPHACVQANVGGLIRQSLTVATTPDRAPLLSALRPLYRATGEDAARSALEAFAASRLGLRYPVIAGVWRDVWPELVPFFQQPGAVRRFLESVDATASFQEKLQRQAVKLPGQYPNIDAAIRHLSQLARNCAGGWKVAPRNWMPLKAHFAALSVPSGRPDF